MGKTVARANGQFQLFEKWKNIDDRTQKFFYPGGKLLVLLFVEIELQIDGAFVKIFSRGVLEPGLGDGVVQRKTDARVAGKLPPVFAPVLDNGQIGGALPLNGSGLYVGGIEGESRVGIGHMVRCGVSL